MNDKETIRILYASGRNFGKAMLEVYNIAEMIRQSGAEIVVTPTPTIKELEKEIDVLEDRVKELEDILDQIERLS